MSKKNASRAKSITRVLIVSLFIGLTAVITASATPSGSFAFLDSVKEFLGIGGTNVSVLKDQPAVATPEGTAAPVMDTDGKLLSSLTRGLQRSNFASMFLVGACDTAGPIEVESTTGTAAGVPTAYSSLTNAAGAFSVINAGVVHTGVITIEICGNSTSEAGTNSLNQVAGVTSISIKPVGGAARTISGAPAGGTPLINLNGADNVTIDGLNTGGNSLTISNTTASATSSTSTIRFIADATNNTVTNSSILGSFSAAVGTNGGNIMFNTGTTTGNDGNTISNNNIGPAGANLPTKGIYCNGSTTSTAIGNSGEVITNNNIFDVFGAAVASAGIYISTGCNTWTITNNRIYQTGTRTWTTGANNIGIDINNSSATQGAQGFTVTGNTIGYATNTQTGTYTLTGSTGKFVGIHFNGITGGTTSDLSGNTIASVSLTGVTSSGTTSSSPFTGILIENGLTTTNSNTIGSQSATGSLTFSTTTTSSTDVFGIYNNGADVWTSNSNNIGGLSITNLGVSGTFQVYGMRNNTGSAVLWTANSNLVGGTVANSIQLSATGTSSQLAGMYTGIPPASLTSNTIRNLTSNIGTGTGTGASVIGIGTATSTPNHTLSQNTIFNLSNINTTAAQTVTGIQFTGSTTNVVERNFIYTLSNASTSASAITNGIAVGGGTTIYRNNMIKVGGQITNAHQVNGILEPVSTGTDSFFHNTVLIAGAPTAGSSNSFAFNSLVVTNTRSFRDNIFVNLRANSGATGKNYAVQVGGTAANPSGLTINNNDYYATGSGTVFGRFNAADVANLAAWKTAVGQDANSFESDPQFNDPNLTVPDLHIHPTNSTVVEGNGGDVGVTNDFDGQTRASFTPVDIGADAGNFTGIDLAAPGISYTGLGNTLLTTNRTVSITITDATAVNQTVGGGPRMWFRKGTSGAYVQTTCSSTGGTVQNGTYNCTIDNSLVTGGGVTGGDTIQYYVAAQDTLGNISTSPSGGSGVTPPGSTAPGSPNSYVITVQISSYPYSQDFETNSLGYTTAINTGSVNDWVLGTPAKPSIAAAHSGTKAWVTKLTGSYSSSHDASVVSPIFNFSALATDPTLTFWQNFDETADPDFDSMVLEVSTNGGTVWSRVDSNVGTGGTFNTARSTGWYNLNGVSAPITGPEWTNTSTAYTGHAAGWIKSTTLLIGLAGQADVRFRWRFVSDGSLVDDGPAIDDVSISADDVTAPVISYTTLTNTTSTANRTQAITVTDNIAVGTGTGLPRIYFRKGTSGAYSTTQCTSSGGTGYDCTIDNSLVTGGSVAGGDTIQYYVAAQDTATTPNVSVNPSTGASGFSSSPPAVSTPPTTPNSYTIATLISGTINVGTGAFTSLTNNNPTTGVFRYLNDNVVAGDLIINVTGNLTIEDGAVALNEFASPYTITINPTGGRTISGTSPNALIKLNGADRVTIDGLNASGNTLSITNSNAAGTVIWLASLGTGAGATNNTIQNTTITGGASTGGSGICVGGSTLCAVGADNDNTTIQGNTILKVFNGISASGIAAVSAGGDDSLVVNNNVVGPVSSGATNIGGNGIIIGNAVSPGMSGNTVQNVVGAGAVSGIALNTGAVSGTVTQSTVNKVTTSSTSLPAYGVFVGSTATSSQVTGNTISNITATATAGGSGTNAYGVFVNATGAQVLRNSITGISNASTDGWPARGIYVNTALSSSSVLLANNMVSDVFSYSDPSPTFGFQPVGIMIDGTTGGVNVYNNSVNLFGSHPGLTGTTLQAALFVGATVTALDVRDNILVNSYDNSTDSTDKSYTIYSAAPNTAYTSIDYNDYYVSGAAGTLAFIGSDRTTLASIVTNFGGNTNSKNAVPNFTLPTNLHILNGPADPVSQVARAGVTISGITTDIDGLDTRKTTPNFPDIGADEFNTYLLTVGTTAGGTITAPASSPVIVNPSAATTITSTANAGFTFTGWTVLTGAATFGNATLLSTTATISGDASVQANFTINTYTVTPSSSGNGSISPNTAQTVNSGATTDFTLTPAANYHIAATTGTCGGSLAGSIFTTAPVTANCTVIANFALDQYSVSYDGNGNTGGTAPATQTANFGSSVTVSGAGSLVRTGYTFSGWNTQAGGGGTPYAAGASFTIPASNTTLYAQWTANTPVISATGALNAFSTTYGTASAAQTQTVSGSDLTVNITATAPTGYEVASDGATFGPTATFTQSGGSASGTLSIRLAALTAPTVTLGTALSYTSTGATQQDVTVSGTVSKFTPAVSATGTTSFIYNASPQGPDTSTVTGVSGGITPTGTVTYSYVGTGGTTYVASAIKPTNVGTYSVTASYPGDANYQLAASSPLAFSITIADQATLTAVSTPSTVVYGTTSTLSSSGGSGTGAVTFSSGGSTGCSVAGTTLSVTNAIGTCDVTATRAADANYNSTDSAPLAVPLQKAAQTIIFGALADKTYGNPDFTVSATGGASGNPVTFAATGSCTVTVALVHLTGAGSCTITASQLGNSNYSDAADVPQSFNIAGTPTVTVAGGPLNFGNQTIFTTSAEQTYTVQGAALTGDITVTSPSTDFEVSLTTGTGFAPSVTLTPTGGTVLTTTIYVHFKPGSLGAKSGDIANASPGAATLNVAVSGTGTAVPAVATKLVVTNISPSTPTAGVGFSVTVQSQDLGGAPTNVLSSTGFTLSTNGNAGAISGTTTGTITAGTSSVVVSGVILPSAGSSVNITATRTSGDVLTAGTSAGFSVVSVPTHFAVTSISPATPTAGAGFTVTVQAQDADNLASNVTAATAFTLTTNGNAGAISGATTGSLNAGFATVTVPGVILANGGTGVTITATRTSGDNLTAGTSATFTVNEAAPTNLTYSTNPATYTKDVAITPNTPSHNGGTVASYGISPALPAGLSFSTSTGVISGTPTVAAAAANYTVTATNTGGSTTVDVNITVNKATPVITFGAAPTPAYPGANFTVSAATTNTDSSTLTYSKVSGPCDPAGGAAFTPTGAGSCVVQADGAATANFNAASSQQTVTITLAQYTITATAGANGSISPSVTVDYGTDVNITITPNAGYHVADVLVDTVSVGAVTSYLFEDVAANHTISATFAINTYTITATAGTNGSISPSGAVSVDHGDSQAFTITPAAGYHVNVLTVDAIVIPAATSYTFTNVTATHTIDVTFALNTYTIMATAGANGSISPNGAVSVNHGASQAFTITPGVGYHVDTLTADGGSVPPAASYTFTNVTATHTIDVTFAANTTPIITFDAAPAPTYLGGDFTVNATTTNTDSPALTYSVVSGPCAPAGGATFSSTGAGTCVVQASGAATTNYNAATATQNVTIAKANQATVTLSGVPGTATYGDTFTAVGGGGSGTGAFSYAVTGTACTVHPSTGAGSVVAVTGGCSVTATRAGDINYNPATSAASAITTINPANQATLTAVATPSTVVYGNTSALSSTGGSGTGAVTFSAGLSNGCSVLGTTLSVTDAGGACAVTATKAADANYNSAASAPLTVTLQKADQATLTVDDPGTVTYGSTPTLTTSGGSGTGAVTFSDGGSAGCTITSGGVLTVINASAACNVTATKATDTNYNAATSAPRTITLARANQATLTAVATPSSVTYGSTSTLSSTGGSGTGTVTFSSGASTGCSVLSTKLSVTDASQTCAVTATRAADSNYNAATSAPLTVTLVKATPTVTFGAAPTPTYLGANFTVSASTTNTDSSALTYSVVSGPCAHVSGATFSSSGAGTCQVQAGGIASSNFTAASATQNISIAKATPTVIFGAAPTPAYPGADFTVSASTSNTDSSALTYSKVSGPCTLVSGATFSSTGAGTCIVRADGAASTNFNAAFDTQNVTIAAVQYTITASAGPNGSISPSGSVVVNSGANQAFTIAAITGYHIADVLVDGVSQGTVGSYTFTNVTANHTISATFAINTYTIGASAGANGSISPSGSVVVNHGANQSFTITPDGGYNVANVVVDGVSVGAVTSHTFTNVIANHTISATFFSGSQALIVYVDDDWAGTPLGADPDGAGPASSFGYDAFATIQNGVAGVAVNGTVIVNPGSYSGDVDVNRVIDVKGVFTISGALTVTAPGASVSPGFSPGIINSGNLSLTAGSNVNIEANGPILGTQYDQLNVTGTVSLGNANLNVTVGNAYTPAAGQTFTIVNNDGNDPVTGAFAGLAENDVFYSGTTSFRISYAGGSNNNDVVLTTVVLCNSVSIPSYTTLNGSAVVASINVNNTTGNALQSTDFTLTYNPAVMTFGSATLGTVTAGSVLNINSSTPGTLVVSIFNPTPFNGAGSMLDITFNAVGQPGTLTPLTFSAFKFNEGTQCISTANGSVSVISGSITGIVTYGNSLPAATRHVPGTTLDAVGSVNASVLTNLAGAYSISSLGAGSYTVTPSKSGGVNGAVTGFDAAQIAMWVVGTTTLNATQQTVADVSGTGGISSFDAALIARYAAALPNAGSSGAWRFSPTGTTYANVNVNRTGDYTALLMGDVSGNWIDPLATRPAPAEELKPVMIGVPELSALVNTEVIVPVEISDTTDKGIVAYQFELRYDPSVLEPSADPADLADTISSGYMVTVNAAERGLLRVVVFGTQPLSGAGRLINLRFNAIGNPGSASDLVWENLGLNEGGFDIRSTNGRVEVTASPSNNASIGGRVLSASGQPIKNARLTLTDTTGQTRIAITNGLGYYQFSGLQLGQTYTVHTSAKRHRFQDVTVSVTGEAVSLDIIAQPGG